MFTTWNVNRSGGSDETGSGTICDHVWYAVEATGEFRYKRNWFEKQEIGGGWRKVSRIPTAFSRSMPSAFTALSESNVTKLQRPACGHTSGRRTFCNSRVSWKVASHWRIH